MKQQKQPRRTLSVRMTETGYEHIEKRAEREDVELSHMVRRMLAYASTHMPDGWVPKR